MLPVNQTHTFTASALIRVMSLHLHFICVFIYKICYVLLQLLSTFHLHFVTHNFISQILFFRLLQVLMLLGQEYETYV